MPSLSPEEHHFNKTWQQQLAEAFTSIEALCDYLELDLNDLPVSQIAATDFPIKVPQSFADRMEKGNPNDPLLRQVLPITDELTHYPGFVNDPVGDLDAAVLPGLLHKYHGRVLLINTGTCAINCRYCFRRNFPYEEQLLGKQQESQVMEYLSANQDVNEVIISGGDPLLLSDARLQNLFNQIQAIPQIKRIRIHSRIPVVLPDRITDDLVKILAESGKQTVLVIHANHANEISAQINATCALLKKQGITLLNQSVLLKGVNDDAEILYDLSEKLFAAGILPYYLHQLDKAKGVGHFEVHDADAKIIIKKVQEALPGYLVPKLVRETAGDQSKQIIS